MGKTVKWEIAGHISVDAGCVIIGDPCYGEIENWADYALESSAEQIPHEGRLEKAADEQGFGRAVILHSGFGDGIYTIEVKKDPASDRIKEMRIRFF